MRSNSAVEVVERRVNAFGVAESITERVGSNRISVQLPGISSDEAIDKIGRTAQLQFMEMARDAQRRRPDQEPGRHNHADPFDQVLAEHQPASSSAPGSRSPRSTRTASAASSPAAYLDRGDIFISSQRRRPADAQLRHERRRRKAAGAGHAAPSQPEPADGLLPGRRADPRHRRQRSSRRSSQAQISDQGIISGLEPRRGRAR